MFIASDKDLKIIGYPQSLLTQDSYQVAKTFIKSNITIIKPEDFFNLENKHQYQFFVGFGLDLSERKLVIDVLDQLNLDCVTYIHETVQIHPTAKIGKGVVIMNFSTVMQEVSVGNHCIIEMYCLVSHNSSIGNNCILHSGTMVAGGTEIGNNCMFNFKSSALNKLKICDNVTVGAMSCITKSITDSGHYIGSPARKLKIN